MKSLLYEYMYFVASMKTDMTKMTDKQSDDESSNLNTSVNLRSMRTGCFVPPKP